MIDMLEYTLRILPGCLLIAMVYLLIPKDKATAFKISLLIFGFILIRDAMTPMGFWVLGLTKHVLWVRFIHDGWVLLGMGVSSLLLTVGVIYTNPTMKSFLKWKGASAGKSILVGIIGALGVVFPIWWMYFFVDVSERGGEVATSLLLPLLFMALAGNFMEEVLFRGYLQGYFEEIMGTYQAAVLSGLMFAAGHAFLATTVTDLGWPILAFTFYEGIICAFVRVKHGIIGSTFTHGLAIFLLSSGLC